MSEAIFARTESERLILRRFEDSDLTPFVAYRNDPEVARYRSWDPCDEQEAKGFIREMGAARVGVPGEWFGFAIESKETGTLIGDCSLGSTSTNPTGPRSGSRWRVTIRVEVSPRKPSRACWITRSAPWGCTGSSP